jgi:hypothetical protein
MKYFVSAFVVFLIINKQVSGQYWQQRITYKINVQVDDAANTFKGTQIIQYTNNSGDTLKKLFMHLYWNAFQPGSSMDARSLDLVKNQLPNERQDWDYRVRDRISKLTPDQMGKQVVEKVTINGIEQALKVYETILEITLKKPIAPKQTVTLNTVFNAQVPVQIRRAGRDNAEGVRYSMAQWYPKMCEYDKEGWHPTPYIAREFYGVWGDFDVTINIKDNYCVAATGYIQNPVPKGFNYEGIQTASKNGMHSWRFVAPNVHDFVWAADPNYIHNSKKTVNGITLHSFYKIDKAKLGVQFNDFGERQKQAYKNSADTFINSYQKQWEDVLELAHTALPFMNATFGTYPYKQYSFIQGGDGGMEYPMATLLKGAGEDVVIHEWLHSWYQMMLGTNESLYSWMDEGFTTYAEDRTKHWLHGGTNPYPYQDNYDSYFYLAKTKFDEPLTTHADQYNSNFAYSINSYSKGAVFMEQLGYVVGAQTRDKILLDYFNTWKFKHPDVNDLIKIAEKNSGLQLDWYKTFFVNTTKTIDYKLDDIKQNAKGGTDITVLRLGKMPMPIDVLVKFKDGSKEFHYVPINLMYGSKKPETKDNWVTYTPWNWTVLNYTITTNKSFQDIVSIEIDPSQRLADIDRRNNKIDLTTVK